MRSVPLCSPGAKSTYRMIVGRADKVTGPYVDREGRPLTHGGGTILLAGDAHWYGVGHGGVYSFDGRDVIVFHGYDAADRGRSKLRTETLRWTDEWPEIVFEKQ